MARLPASSQLPGQVALASVLTVLRPKFCNHKMDLRQLTLQSCGGALVQMKNHEKTTWHVGNTVNPGSLGAGLVIPRHGAQGDEQ